MSKDASKIRQGLNLTEERRKAKLEHLLNERLGLIRGFFGKRARVCGNPGCRCARGELHEAKYLSATVDGVTRQVHVPKRDEVTVAEGVKRYRLWKKLRTQIAELSDGELALIDELCVALLRAYPPSDPIPPPRRRGRKPRRNGR